MAGPWEKYQNEEAPAPAGPWEKYAKEDPSVVEDVAKATAPSALRGTLGALTQPGTLGDLFDQGAGWAINKFAPDSRAAGAIKFLRGIDTDPKTGGSIGNEHSFFPSFGTVKDKAEKVTGPLYEAQTPVGKGWQTGVEAVPSFLGGSLVGTLGKSIGAGTGSALLGEGAKAAGDLLPTWAEPVGRLVGGVFGSGMPAALRRGRTPLPMTDEQLAKMNSITIKNPELANVSSAGQVTDRPWVTGMEARSPRMADLPEKQAEAYTQGVMRESGSTGMFDKAGKAEAKQVGKDLEILRDAHSVSPTEMALLKAKLRQDYIDLSTHAGVEAAKPLLDFRENIRLGPMRGTPNFPTKLNDPLHPTDIPGRRVADLLQTSTQASPSSVETAMHTARKDLLDAFHRSMPATESAKHMDLSKKYSNWKTIEDIKTKADQNTISPDQVFGKAPDSSELKQHATEAASIMKPLPAPSAEPSAATKALHSIVGGLFGTAAGAAGAPGGAVDLGMLGAIAGKESLPYIIETLKNTAGRTMARPGVQSWLKNQAWRPDAYTTAPDKEMMLRLLMSHPQALPSQSR